MFYSATLPKRHLDIYKKIKTGFFPIFGSGKFHRSVVSVADLAECAVVALNSIVSNEIFYVCDDNVYTTRSIIEEIASAVGVSKLRFIRFPAFFSALAYRIDSILQDNNIYVQSIHLVGEADWSVGYSNKKLREVLKFNPKHSYSEVLKNVRL